MPDAFAELASPARIHDPCPFMRWLREHDPVHRAASGLFLLSRHADIYWALKATGDAFRAPAPGELVRYFPRAATSLSLNLLASTLAMKDPPAHMRLRRLISRDFTMRQIENLRPSIARIVAARPDGMAPALERGKPVDLHREFALALPMLVLAEPVRHAPGRHVRARRRHRPHSERPGPARQRPPAGRGGRGQRQGAGLLRRPLYSVSAPIPATTSCRCWSAHTTTMPTRCRMRS
ncbi:cytochrome P450 [Bradyrhizobium sp. LA2.1]